MFKTGTANQYQHIWALGATSRFTVGVWMGNFSGETVIGRTGSSIPARIASALLTALEGSQGNAAGNLPATAPTENPADSAPAMTEEADICVLSGMSAGPFCAGVTRERFLYNKVPAPCSWHTGSGLFYPAEYRSWLAERFRTGTARQGGGMIRMPVSGAVFYADPGLPAEAQALRVETAGFTPDALVYLDGAVQGSLNYAGVYILPLYKGRHTITVEDENGMASADFEVR
jgi:penicillin-binding protein 1C